MIDRTKCDECGGKLIRKKVPYSIYKIKIGNFPAEVCTKCGEACFSEETSKSITEAVKKKRLWGLGSKTRVGKVGDALDIRLNKRLVKFLKVKKGDAVEIIPESKNRVVVFFHT